MILSGVPASIHHPSIVTFLHFASWIYKLFKSVTSYSPRADGFKVAIFSVTVSSYI